MADDKILDPYALVSGVTVPGYKLGMTKEAYQQKKAEAENDSSDQIADRDQKQDQHDRYTYKQKVKTTLDGELTEEKEKDFIETNDPEGKYEEEHQEAVRDIKDATSSLRKHEEDLAKMDEEYATYQNKEGSKAKDNRASYAKSVETRAKDEAAKKGKEDAEAEEMKTVEAEIYTLTGILENVDKDITEYDTQIGVFVERKATLDKTAKDFSEKYKDHQDHFKSVDEIISKDECSIPTAREAHLQASAYYRGRRICDKINEAIAQGKYHCWFTYLHETEVEKLVASGYYVTIKKDQNQKDKKEDLDDDNNYGVHWNRVIDDGPKEA